MPNIPFARDLPSSMQDVRNEFDRWLDRLWHSGWTTAPLDGQDWAPRVDVVDEADCFRLRAEVPGLTAEDVELSFLDGALTIKGTKPSCRGFRSASSTFGCRAISNRSRPLAMRPRITPGVLLSGGKNDSNVVRIIPLGG